MGLFMLGVAVLVGLAVYVDVRPYVLKFFAWLDLLGPWAPVLFIIMDMLVVILVLPGVILTLGAGFTFGVPKGSTYVIIATTLGATLAFLIARHLFGQRVSRFVWSRSKLNALNQEFSRQGWKIVLLTRLVPFFPFKLSNYLFGLMQISLGDFVCGVLFGIIPITVHNVYIGSLAADLATLGYRNQSRSPLQWTMYAMGLVAAVCAVVYLRRLARRALGKYISKGELA